MTNDFNIAVPPPTASNRKPTNFAGIWLIEIRSLHIL